MSYRTLEVELENGRVRPRQTDALPAKARALLTILETPPGLASSATPDTGLNRFLTAPDFALSAEQFRTSMEADFWEQ